MRKNQGSGFWKTIGIGCILSLIVSFGPATTASGITIKMANGDSIAKIDLTTSNGQFCSQDLKCQSFKRFIEKSSSGRIEVKIFANCQLGGEREMWEMTKQGSLQMNGCSTSVLANFVPEINAIHIPYIFKDSNVAFKVLNGPVGKELEKLVLKRIGVRILAWQHETDYNFMSKDTPIRVPSDLKGLKIRVIENPAIVKMTQLTGAAPTPIPFSEVYTSLHQGVVDGVSTGIVFIKAIGLDKIIKHMNVSDPWMGPGVIAINEKFFQSLSPEDQYLVKESAIRSSLSYQGMSYYGRDLWVDYFKTQGVDVHIPNQKQKAEWIKTLRNPMIEYQRDKIGDYWIDKVIEASKKAENELYR